MKEEGDGGREVMAGERRWRTRRDKKREEIQDEMEGDLMRDVEREGKEIGGEVVEDDERKDGPGPVMVSSTLCPAVHILGSQNVYGRAEGIADHYWPWAVFFKILKFRQGSGPEGDDVL